MRLLTMIAGLAALGAAPAGAATIINATATGGSAIATGDLDAANLETAYSSTDTRTAFVLNEGQTGATQSFLLVYDWDGEGSQRVSGSFDIDLAGGSFLGFETTTAGLIGTDPANGAAYQTAPGAFATLYRGLERDDTLTVAEVDGVVRVTYSLANDIRALDNVRFLVETPLAAVPEPASWAMMIAGFGMVGGALRTRRRLPTVTA